MSDVTLNSLYLIVKQIRPTPTVSFGGDNGELIRVEHVNPDHPNCSVIRNGTLDDVYSFMVELREKYPVYPNLADIPANERPQLLSIIAAIGQPGNIIGTDEPGKWGLPWGRIPEDLQRFQELTLHHTVIVGRKTYDTLPFLPGRKVIVVSKSSTHTNLKLINPALHAPTLKKALWHAKDDGEVFIIGGAQIYEQTLPIADRMYLTTVTLESDRIPGNTKFPQFDLSRWELGATCHSRHNRGDLVFKTYAKKRG